MADTAPQGTPPPKKGKKKIPTWYYIAGAGALIVAYYAYSKSQASKAAAAAATTPGTGGGIAAGTGTGSYGNAGDLAALAPYLNQQAASTTGSTTGSGASYTLPSGENFIGSGYGFTPSAQGGGVLGNIIPSQTPATSTSGASYVEVPQANIAQLISGGQQVYYQPAPGVFTPLPSGATAGNLQGLVGTTPLFIQSGSGQ